MFVVALNFVMPINLSLSRKLVLKDFKNWKWTLEDSPILLEWGVVGPQVLKRQAGQAGPRKGSDTQPLQHCALLEKALNCPAFQAPLSDVPFSPLSLGQLFPSCLGTPFSFSSPVPPGIQPPAQGCTFLSHLPTQCQPAGWFCTVLGWQTITFFSCNLDRPSLVVST